MRLLGSNKLALHKARIDKVMTDHVCISTVNIICWLSLQTYSSSMPRVALCDENTDY